MKLTRLRILDITKTIAPNTCEIRWYAKKFNYNKSAARNAFKILSVYALMSKHFYIFTSFYQNTIISLSIAFPMTFNILISNNK